MGYTKEPKDIDFVVEPHVDTEEGHKIMSKIIANYKANGKVTRAPGQKAKPDALRKRQKNNVLTEVPIAEFENDSSL